MIWYTPKVNRLDNLQAELRRLQTASHTIFSVVVVDGFAVIISHAAA